MSIRLPWGITRWGLLRAGAVGLYVGGVVVGAGALLTLNVTVEWLKALVLLLPLGALGGKVYAHLTRRRPRLGLAAVSFALVTLGTDVGGANGSPVASKTIVLVGLASIGYYVYQCYCASEGDRSVPATDARRS